MDQVKNEIRLRLDGLKNYLITQPDFSVCQEIRSVVATVITLQGSIDEGDVVELGELCLAFCTDKVRENQERN